MANTPKIRPLADRLLVEPEANETKTEGGIVIPDTADKKKPVKGKVVAIGDGKYVDGTKQPLQVKIGDQIMYGQYAGTNVKFEGKDYLFMREEDVMGVLE